MSKTKQAVTLTIENANIIVVGDNHYYGIGMTVEEARKLARSPRRYQVWLAHPDAYIDVINGAVISPVDCPARLIMTVGKKR